MRPDTEGQLVPAKPAGQAEMDALEERLERQINSWFAEGPGREWTDEDWAALKRGEFGRRQEVEALSTMRGMDLADPEVMERAWRS